MKRVKKGELWSNESCHVTKSTCPVPEDISARYHFSKYLIDPNRHCFKTIIRIVAFVKRFNNNCQYRIQQKKSNANIDPARCGNSGIQNLKVLILDDKEYNHLCSDLIG